MHIEPGRRKKAAPRGEILRDTKEVTTIEERWHVIEAATSEQR
jgi:hypothetical protein